LLPPNLLRSPLRGNGAFRKSSDTPALAAALDPDVHRRNMRTYEVMTIHRPDLSEDDIAAKVDGVASFLTDRGATVNGKDIWGKRRFAYEIDHLHEGYYAVLTFAAEPAVISDLDRMLTLADEVVRHKIVRPPD
jgi:small subunit ribosomal protein S6